MQIFRLDQLTIISFILVCLSKYIYKYINLLFITIFVCIAGLYISYSSLSYESSSYLYPNVNSTEFNICKFYIDILLHILPVMYIYINYKDYYISNPSSETAIIFVILYVCLVKVENVYNLIEDKNTIVLGYVFTIMVFVYVFIIMK